MRELIVTIQKKLNVTTIFVTHDQEEAVLLADKIALIFDGELQNFTSPKNYYEHPKNIKAAKFFGGVNFIKTTKNKNILESELGDLTYDGDNIDQLDKENIITIRPENIQISTQNEFDHNSFKGIIKSVIFSGTHTRYKISIDTIELECSLQSVGIKNIKENDKVYIHLPKNKIWGMNG
jgi:ABC-type Fe3+/spermidine/putrescine transport system ATPase subunit